MTQNKKQIATSKNPSIAAVLAALFRYEKLEHATEMLATIAEHFITSKESAPNTLKIWVKGKDILTEDEKKQGYLGHYYIFEVAMVDKRYTLFATIVECV
jgi:hypothetical protein